MKLNPATRARLLVDVTLDFDPTGSTVEVSIDGTWYPASWLGSPVAKAGRWTQTARTTGYFAGPDVAVLAGATVLAAGPRHNTRTRVIGTDTLVNESTPIDVA